MDGMVILRCGAIVAGLLLVVCTIVHGVRAAPYNAKFYPDNELRNRYEIALVGIVCFIALIVALCAYNPPVTWWKVALVLIELVVAWALSEHAMVRSRRLRKRLNDVPGVSVSRLPLQR